MSVDTSEQFKRAIRAIQSLKTQLEQANKPSAESPIAIVGAGVRFPGGVDTLEKFWSLLNNSHITVSDVPESRWRSEVYREIPYTQRGSFLSEPIDAFDAHFFNISPREAAMMDPQQRLLLEVAWEALENAGVPLDRLRGSGTGVFIGITGCDYERVQNLQDINEYFATGAMVNIAAGRIAHFLGVHGPTLSVDTACSSSLVAAHLACESLRSGACDMAIAGGVSLMISPDIFSALCHLRALSPDGRCKSFEANADGYGRGEGCGIVVLKRFTDAVRDGDSILAVISGSAINHDGASSGLTAPNPAAQEKVIATALANAGIPAAKIGYVETHGTGTSLGDPIEIQAIQAVYGVGRSFPLALGTLKPNVGHLEAAAGIAGLIKVALALHHGIIPPQVHIENLNPAINLDQIPALIALSHVPWPVVDGQRLGGVSSFGFSGTNAHMILAEGPPDQPRSPAPEGNASMQLTISAKSLEALIELAGRYVNALQVIPAENFCDFCFTANTARSLFPHRFSIKSADSGEAIELLNAFRDAGDKSPGYSKDMTIAPRRAEKQRKRIPSSLPLYPFQRKRYWHTSRLDGFTRRAIEPELLESPLPQRQFIFRWSQALIPSLRDTHGLVHVGFFQEMLARSLRRLHGVCEYTLDRVRYQSPLIVPEGEARDIQLVLTPSSDSRYELQIFTKAEPTWSLHVDGEISLIVQNDSVIGDLEGIRARCTQELPGFYDLMKARGVELGPSVRYVDAVWTGEKEAIARFRPLDNNESLAEAALAFPPGILDACAQMAHALREAAEGTLYIVAAWESACIHNYAFTGSLWCHVALEQQDERSLTLRASILTSVGQTLFKLSGCRMVAISQRGLPEVVQPLSEGQSEQAVVQTLRTTLSSWLGMEPSELDLEEPLRSYGLDSLVSMQLRSWIEQTWGASIPVRDLLRGPSLQELAELIAHRQAPAPARQTANPWIANYQPVTSAKLRLFCFPYGGGGASLYRHWQSQFPTDVQVCPVQLPGREERFHEPAARCIGPLVEQIAANLKPLLDRPFAVYGHSFGALLATELIHHLRDTAGLTAAHFFAAAFTAPQLPNSWLRRCRESLYQAGFSVVPDPDVEPTDELRDIFLGSEKGLRPTRETPELASAVMPLLLSDLKVVDSFRYQEPRLLSCPITAFHGIGDERVTLAEMKAWEELTTGPFRVQLIEGDHFFLHADQSAQTLIQLIGTELHGAS